MAPLRLFVIVSNIIYINSQLSRNPLTDRTDATTQTLISDEGPWGTWGAMKYCDEGQWLKTIEFRSESNQGTILDDVAGVGVALICEEPGSTTEYRYEYRSYSSPHNWGSWYGTNPATCPSGSWVVGFRTNIERWCYDRGCNVFSRPQCCGVDDTSLNCIQLICSDGETVLTPTDCRNWGDGYPSSYSQCDNGYICGWQERFEEDEAIDDESALNAVRFACCDYTDSPTTNPTATPTENPTLPPSSGPTEMPSIDPTVDPTDIPSIAPTFVAFAPLPSGILSSKPTDYPTPEPTPKPTPNPTRIGSADVDHNNVRMIVQHHPWMPVWMGFCLAFSAIMCCCMCIMSMIWYSWLKSTNREKKGDDVKNHLEVAVENKMKIVEGGSDMTMTEGPTDKTPHRGTVTPMTEISVVPVPESSHYGLSPRDMASDLVLDDSDLNDSDLDDIEDDIEDDKLMHDSYQ